MIILASQSPRRQELLSLIIPHFEVRPTYCDETCLELTPTERVLEIAVRKAQAAKAAEKQPAVLVRKNARGKALSQTHVHHQDNAIIAADTVVFIDGEILEKPVDAADAERMLRLLSGRTHTVATGVCVAYQGLEHCFTNCTEVTFAKLSSDLIRRYVATGEPMDKAGAYGIQGRGALLVDSICGDYFTVMGLPVRKLFDLLLHLQIIG